MTTTWSTNFLLGSGGGALLISTVVLYGLRKYFAGGVNRTRNADLSGKMVIVTGANTGIGYWTAWELARLGATVILACRSTSRGESARQQMVDDLKQQEQGFKLDSVQNRVKVQQLDLSDLESVRAFVDDFRRNYNRLDLLINNAGVMMPLTRQETKQGFELQLGTNHFGHFVLTRGLLPLLKQSAPSRIVNVSSRAHERGKIDFSNINFEKEGSYSPMDAYGQSKLANVLFTKELARRLKGTGIVATSLHPGVVETELMRYLNESAIFKWVRNAAYPLRKLFFKTSWEGAQTTLHCALSPECGKEENSGKYFSDCQVKDSPNPNAHDDELDRRFWIESSRMVNLPEEIDLGK